MVSYTLRPLYPQNPQAKSLNGTQSCEEESRTLPQIYVRYYGCLSCSHVTVLTVIICVQKVVNIFTIVSNICRSLFSQTQHIYSR
jgi:transcription elongation factor Elf1